VDIARDMSKEVLAYPLKGASPLAVNVAFLQIGMLRVMHGTFETNRYDLRRRAAEARVDGIQGAVGYTQDAQPDYQHCIERFSRCSFHAAAVDASLGRLDNTPGTCNFSTLFFRPVTVSVCSRLNVIFLTNIELIIPRKLQHVYIIHILRRLHANASFAACFPVPSGIEWMMKMLAAASFPVNSSVTLCERPAARSFGDCASIEFWKITPPRMIDIARARVRINAKVDVAVATSS